MDKPSEQSKQLGDNLRNKGGVLMKDKNVRTGRLLSKIGGIICLGIAGVMLLISMVTPVALNLNGEQYLVTLWEMDSYPSAFLFWKGILFYSVGYCGTLHQ
ncbi:hypothetical protein [Oceanobacillus saliphilus]|uniref:hypothetical protein n=1 Tax=Oceanobacillus saliphilus TaxID=2925834 RepID=UPI00201DBB18|nr:hypothetical protein [Oceanobacillus saliphilus]